MVDIDPQFLGAISTAGVLNTTRSEYTTAWSTDNQVALITDGGGILIVVRKCYSNRDCIKMKTQIRMGMLVALQLLLVLKESSGDLFPLPEFTGKDVTAAVFGNQNDEIFPVAFGDLNADKLTDVVTVTKDKSSLVVLYSRQEAPYLQRDVHCQIRTSKNRTVEIVGVAPGDFTGDGLVDLAVTIEQVGTKDRELLILKGATNDLICDTETEQIIAFMVQEPLAADLNGDMIVDLIGEVSRDDSQNNNGEEIQRKIWLFHNGDKTPPTQVPFVVEEDGNLRDRDFRRMANPSSNAFLDIDGDYVPELVMITETTEAERNDNKLLRNTKYVIETYNVNVHSSYDPKYPVTFVKKGKDIPVLKNNTHVINTIGQPLFVDLNQNGQLVYILPFCSEENCKGKSEAGLLAVVNGSTVVLPLQGTDYDGKKWMWKHVSKHPTENSRSSFDRYYSRTVSLRVGDYNLDGFPDLIGVVASGQASEEQAERRAVVLENVPCKVSATNLCPFPRTFNFKFDVLQNYANVTLAAFYDIHDDGLIDVFLVRRTDNNTKENAGKKYEVRAFENSPDYDSNFFKVMVLSGRPCPKCPQNGIPYGNVVTGPIIKYRTTTQLGERQTAVAAQNYRSSHLSMDLPYTIFGIGHSPNFVETLIVGMSPTGNENRTHDWPQIIPNSQIIVIPPQIGTVDAWKFKLFLTPSDAVWKTFAVLIGVILVVLTIDFVHTFEDIQTGTCKFIGNETSILCSGSKDQDLENYTGISLSRVLRSKEKSEIFEVVRDSIICPKELINAEVHLYFIKVEWSHRPLKLKSTNEGKFQYILGALDSYWKLKLFVRQGTQCEDVDGLPNDDDWTVCVDFTESYRNLLLQQFWKINAEDEASFNARLFSEYRQRMYELATVDFVWIPKWEESHVKYDQLSEGESQTSLVTAHASGDICIWNLCVLYHEKQPRYYLTLEFRQKLVPDEMVRSLKFHKLSPSLGVLIVGTTKGSVKVFKMNYNGCVSQALKTLTDEQQPQKYLLDNGIVLCDEDLMEIQTTCVAQHKTENGDGNGDPTYKISLYVFKHPNFLLPFDLDVSEDQISVTRALKPSRTVQGTLTGALLFESKNMLMTLSHRGILSMKLIMDSGELQNIASHDLSDFENQSCENTKLNEDLTNESGGEQRKGRLQFGGLQMSPNKAMICVSKTLAEYYNHLALRTPSVLQFHSLFPAQNLWSFVYEQCVQNDFYLHRITDVLAAYQVLMAASDQKLKEVLDWTVPLAEKSIQDLQIVFWALRMQPHVDRDQFTFAYNLKEEQPRVFLELKFKEIRAQRRETLVLDRIMQLWCRDLVEKVVEDPIKYQLEENVLNLQSLKTIYDFLGTKKRLLKERPLPLKPRLLYDPEPRKPACPLCGKATRLLKNPPERWRKNDDFSIEYEFDKEDFDGVLWHEQEHVQKARLHSITNCILSLIPAAYPHRKCTLCGTVCMLSPAFGQKPLCPLCNGLMNPPGEFYTDEELDEGAEQVEAIVEQLEQQKMSELKASINASSSVITKADAAAAIRRSKIERMYIDHHPNEYDDE
ncbi:unnamed protein product [Orchesella dallaii]|uniref:Uncharacterized protein n=1 Tax=Orchesella dallaii TaxID=48710 RepID=A0ABP1PTJ5_9HEXA